MGRPALGLLQLTEAGSAMLVKLLPAILPLVQYLLRCMLHRQHYDAVQYLHNVQLAFGGPALRHLLTAVADSPSRL